MARTNEEMDDLQKGLPYLRTAVAFLIYLVKAKHMSAEITSCYSVADIFIDKLKEDVNAS